MRSLFTVILLSMLVQDATQNQPGVIQGVATRAGTNEPLSGVHIAVGLGYLPPVTNSRIQYSANLVPVASSVVTTVTDENGRFSVSNLSAGTYTVRAYRDGFWGFVENGVSSLSASKEVHLEARNPKAQVTFPLIPGGLVTGHVELPNGQPAQKMTVNAYTVHYANGRRMLAAAFSEESDDHGDYRLFSLPPDDYYIGAAPPQRGPLAAASTMGTTFFPKVSDARQSQVVKIVPGAEISGINISMQNLTNVMVSGRIERGDGSPINGAFNFMLVPRDESAIVENIERAFRNSALESAKGQFELRGVEPGSYRLYVRLIQSTLGGFAEIDVPERGLRDIVITIHEGVDVRGRLMLNDAALPPETPPPVSTTVAGAQVTLPVLAPRISLRASDSTTIARTYSSDIDSTGRFVFTGVPPGVYQIAGPPGSIGPGFPRILPANGYVADIRSGGSLYDSGIAIDGRSPDEIQVVIRTDAATVEGSVVDARNNPVERAGVVLVPASNRDNDLRYGFAVADANGHFSITNVHLGVYKAFASTEGITAYATFRSSWYRQKVEDRGVSLSVTPGEKKTLVLQPISN